MAESSFAEKVNMDYARNYMEEYSTDVMTGGRNERMQLYYQLVQSLQKAESVDIIVSLDKSKPIGLKFFGMWNDLEELLGRKVDLVSEGTLLPFAQESVERDKILVYERTK